MPPTSAKCPKCPRMVDIGSPLEHAGSAKPFGSVTPGIVVICEGCAGALVVTPDFTLRELTPADQVPPALAEIIEAAQRLSREAIGPVVRRKLPS